MARFELTKVENIAKYYIKYKSTVRKTAKKFGVSKSTVHKYLRNDTKKYFPNLYPKVETQLKLNAQAAHLRGGLANKKRFQTQKK